MKEEKGIIHRGEGAHLRCPVSATVQFSLRNEGSSEYMCLCEGRESLCPNFQTFQDPRHQFHGIGRLVSGLLFLGLFITTYAGGNDSWEFLHSLKVHKIEIFFGFDFEICIISLLVMSKYSDFTKKNFNQAIIGGDTIFPLSLRLSGIEFSLV